MGIGIKGCRPYSFISLKCLFNISFNSRRLKLERHVISPFWIYVSGDEPDTRIRQVHGFFPLSSIGCKLQLDSC